MADALYWANTTSRLYMVLPDIGDSVVISEIGNVIVGGHIVKITGMTWDATTSTLWAVTGTSDAHYPAHLITIDPTTGAGTDVGALGLTGGKSCTDISCNASGLLYGWRAGNNGCLVSINKSTGAGTQIGSSTSWGGGFEFISGVAYWIEQNGVIVETVDLATGAKTSAFSVTSAAPLVGAAAFYNGLLYVGGFSQFVSVDMSSHVGTFQDFPTGPGDVDALARIPIPPAPPIPSVPPNDDFANATEIFGGYGSIVGYTNTASPDWPTGFSDTSKNVWYKFTPDVTGDYTFSTPETSNIYVFTGTFPGLTDLTSGFPVTVTMTAGTEYYIMVAYVSAPTFTLSWLGPYLTPFRTEWKIGLYDKDSNGKNSTSYDGSVTDEFLKHATDCTLTYPLNGIDQLEFSLLLDDPAALLLTRKNTFVRVWRFINDTENSKTRIPNWQTPDFCGVVTSITKSGEENKVKVTVMSVLWLVQVHFHLLNHRLVVDPDSGSVPFYREGSNETGLQWDHSALMFHLIDLINGAFKFSGGDTGIRKPPTAAFSGTGYMSGFDLYWPQTIATPPLYVMKGQYTWPIFTELLGRDGAPDMVPEYIWNPGSIDRMYFKTAIIRGTNKTSTVSFDYHTGQKNLSDCEEQSQVVPGEYGNFLWVSGDGGPNSNLLVQSSDTTDITNSGVYMVSENIPGSKLADVQQYSDGKKKVLVQADSEIYSATISPASPLYYDLDYTLGDLVNFNADKGALKATNKHQRIYQVTLHWSDNNVESTDVMISNDFKRKFP
jgi:hypothetical protein